MKDEFEGRGSVQVSVKGFGPGRVFGLGLVLGSVLCRSCFRLVCLGFLGVFRGLLVGLAF